MALSSLSGVVYSISNTASGCRVSFQRSVSRVQPAGITFQLQWALTRRSWGTKPGTGGHEPKDWQALRYGCRRRLLGRQRLHWLRPRRLLLCACGLRPRFFIPLRFGRRSHISPASPHWLFCSTQMERRHKHFVLAFSYRDVSSEDGCSKLAGLFARERGFDTQSARRYNNTFCRSFYKYVHGDSTGHDGAHAAALAPDQTAAEAEQMNRKTVKNGKMSKKQKTRKNTNQRTSVRRVWPRPAVLSSTSVFSFRTCMSAKKPLPARADACLVCFFPNQAADFNRSPTGVGTTLQAPCQHQRNHARWTTTRDTTCGETCHMNQARTYGQ